MGGFQTYVEVLHDVDLSGVLAQRADADAVAAIADQVLHDDVRAVGLERDAVVAVVNVRVLNDNVVGAVGVPAIGILGWVLARAVAEDVDVGKDDFARVGDERVPLRAVAEVEI